MNSLAEPTTALFPRYLHPLSILPPEPVTRKLLILGDSPIFTRAIQALLQNGSTACSSQIVTSAELSRRPGARQVDTVLLVPQDWQELAAWLARLRRRLAPCPWLLLADLRLVGMFLSFLVDQQCALVEPNAPAEMLDLALGAVVERRFAHPSAELMARFARNAPISPAGARARHPTAMELQCACAVSFGLRDGQIAQVLQLSEATVKSHVHHMLQKLALKNRVELGCHVTRAFAPVAG